MRHMLAVLFTLSIFSCWAIAFSLGHCMFIYTGSYFYSGLFQISLSFLLSLFVSQYIIEKFLRPMFDSFWKGY